eukprot:Nk52_evm4s634 gene=Nk52_evmTU4s634
MSNKKKRAAVLIKLPSSCSSSSSSSSGDSQGNTANHKPIHNNNHEKKEKEDEDKYVKLFSQYWTTLLPSKKDCNEKTKEEEDKALLFDYVSAISAMRSASCTDKLKDLLLCNEHSRIIKKRVDDAAVEEGCLYFNAVIITSLRAAEVLVSLIESSSSSSSSLRMCWKGVRFYVVGEATCKYLRKSILGRAPEGNEEGSDNNNNSNNNGDNRLTGLGCEILGGEKDMCIDAKSLLKFILQRENEDEEESFLFLCGEQKRDDLPKGLKEAGKRIQELVVYKTEKNPDYERICRTCAKEIIQKLLTCGEEVRDRPLSKGGIPSGEFGVELEIWVCFFNPLGVQWGRVDLINAIQKELESVYSSSSSSSSSVVVQVRYGAIGKTTLNELIVNLREEERKKDNDCAVDYCDDASEIAVASLPNPNSFLQAVVEKISF